MPDIPGLCGIVPGSIIPGMYGLEAGQSAVGDIFNWFVSHLAPAKYTAKGDPHANLTRDAEKLRPGESGLLALDWNNGNRTILVDPLLTGLAGRADACTPRRRKSIVRWSKRPPSGRLTIINRFEEYGVQVKEVVNCGGIAEKNPFVMQIYADVCNRPMKISRSAQTCALGGRDLRRGGRRGVQDGRAGPAKDDRRQADVLPARQEARGESTPSCTRCTAAARRVRHGQHISESLGHVMKDLIAIRNRVRKG